MATHVNRINEYRQKTFFFKSPNLQCPTDFFSSKCRKKNQKWHIFCKK